MAKYFNFWPQQENMKSENVLNVKGRVAQPLRAFYRILHG